MWVVVGKRVLGLQLLMVIEGNVWMGRGGVFNVGIEEFVFFKGRRTGFAIRRRD